MPSDRSPRRSVAVVTGTRRDQLLGAGFDVAAVILFVALGRGSHDEGSSVGGTLRVAAPFVLGLALGWLVARAWRAPFAVRTGVVVWLVTVAAGMLIRHTAFDRGTAFAFIIVATLFLGLFLVGWRAVATKSRDPQGRLAAKRVQ
jgi:hypothetical protein